MHDPDNRQNQTAARKDAQRELVWVRDLDLYGKIKEQEAQRSTWKTTIYFAYHSLGVIYGDIGTSIIYVFSQIFYYSTSALREHSSETELYQRQIEEDVYGAVSLIFWTLTLIALLKYVFIVIRANDTGEGGTVALYAQLCRTMGISPFGTMRKQDHAQIMAMKSAGNAPRARPTLGEHRHRQAPKSAAAPKTVPTEKPYIKPMVLPLDVLVLEPFYMIRWFRRTSWAQRILLFFTMLATGLIIGDGVIMPAFSVNSAISGININLSDDQALSTGAIIGISVAIIVLLFLTQHFGTEKLAWGFSPVIVVWLLSNMSIGIYNLSYYGGAIFNGLNPRWIVVFLGKYGMNGWEMLGGVMLCVAGTETMFAAMGHFSQNAVAMAFCFLVYPSLVISYLGQGAFLIHNPQSALTTYWSSIPNPIFWPMLVLATLAAIVASQAVITGTFSILRQASALGVFPKLRVIHTNSFVEGQIFIPVVNYTLMLLCIAVLAGFQGDNVKLGEAYGVAVMAVMLVTTCMVCIIMLVKWELSLLLILPFLLWYIFIEGVFLSATLFKVPNGGWFPLAMAVVVLLIMGIWWAGAYARRRVLLRTSKQQHAHTFFKEVLGNTSMARTTSCVTRSETNYGSAVDLTALSVNARGYNTHAEIDDIIYQNTMQGFGVRDALSGGQAELPQKVTKAALLFGSRPAEGGSGAAGRGTLQGQRRVPLQRASAAPAVRLGERGGGGRPLGEGSEGAAAAAPAGDATSEIQAALRAAAMHTSKIALTRRSANLRAPPANPAPAAPAGAAAVAAAPAAAPPAPPAVAAVLAPQQLSPLRTPQRTASPARPPLGTGSPGHVSVRFSDASLPTVNSGGRYGSDGGGAGLAATAGVGSTAGSVTGSIDGQGRSGLRRRVSFVESKASELGDFDMTCRSKSLALTSQPEKPLARLSGMGMFYSDSPSGIPPVMTHFLRNIDGMHEVVILLTVRFLPMPFIDNVERLLVRSVQGVPNFYQVVARYGYQDVVDHRYQFVSHVVATIMHKLELKAGLKCQGLEDDFIHELEGDDVDADDQAEPASAAARNPGGDLSTVLEESHGTHAAARHSANSSQSGSDRAQDEHPFSPFISRFALEALDRIKIAASGDDAPQAAKDALESAQVLLNTVNEQVVYYLGRAFTRTAQDSGLLRSLTIGGLYRTLEMMSYTDSEAWQIPLDNMVELGMALEI